MQCAKCGYMMTAFDKTCPRCPQLKDYKECPQCRKFIRSAANACEECGYDYRPKPQPAPLPPQPAPAPMMAPAPAPAFPQPRRAVLPEHVLHCPMCGRKDTQKVSAIYQAGSWTESTSGTVDTIGGVLWDGPMFVSTGVTSQETQGHSRLASALAPPPRPQGGYRALGALIVGILFLLVCRSVVSFSLPLCIFIIGIPILIFGLLCAPLGLYLIGRGIKGLFQDARAARDMPRWMMAMDIWQRLFYCGRCDSVFDPATGQAAPSHQIRSLI